VQAVADFIDRGVDCLTTAILSFKSGAKATLTCGMLLATEQDKRIDRFQIHGTKGCIKSETAFNQCGELKYTLITDAGEVEKSVIAPQNYCLEVEQLGRCIAEGEKIHVTHEFTRMNARVLEAILKEIKY
ncbi:MAG: gfo/Idh/MocA family oxidoreductase, partial [Clostridia bacterium]|nr:gfo/Idh/MocA family oxidoreductase [Clostridia bacterium]